MQHCPLPHFHRSLTGPREAALIVHAPAQGTRSPGRSCRAAKGQAGLAVSQEAPQAQAAGSQTLQERRGQESLFTGAYEIRKGQWIEEFWSRMDQEIGEGN